MHGTQPAKSTAHTASIVLILVICRLTGASAGGLASIRHQPSAPATSTRRLLQSPQQPTTIKGIEFVSQFGQDRCARSTPP